MNAIASCRFTPAAIELHQYQLGSNWPRAALAHGHAMGKYARRLTIRLHGALIRRRIIGH
jgi:hypothetical protein